MSVKSDKWIRRMAAQGMIEPFEAGQVKEVAGRRVVQTVPRRGFRLDPPRDRLDATAPRPMVLALCAAAVAGAALWWHLSTRGAAPSAEPLPRLSLAILPMAAAGREPEQAAFAAQITEGLAMSAFLRRS